MIKDNRLFIENLEKTGDVVRIGQEVDWDLEAGAIVRRSNESKGPACLFEKVRDYPPGFRLFGSPLGSYRRMAVAMGLKPDSHIREIQDEYESRTEHHIKPVVVKRAPCKENIIKGEDVDLFRFPVPMIHDGDGGRHIGTWHLIITRDPGSEWVNWGLYRIMAHSRRYTSMELSRGNDGGRLFFGKYVPKKLPMPIAVAIGVDPLCTFVAGASIGVGQNEADFAGGLHKEPVELVETESGGLFVPASAEIILEGEVLPELTALDGPHGEFTGYRNTTRVLPVFQVKTITFRNNPIFTFTNMGLPQEDSGICMGISAAVSMKKRLKKNGLPVKDVSVPPLASSYLAIVSLKSSASSYIKALENLLKLHGVGEIKTVVVDEDVDVFNLEEVVHALATKCHPEHGIKTWELNYNIELTPYLNDREKRESRGTRVLFDCTWPADWSRQTDIPPRVSFNEVYPEEVKQKVVDNWKAYGFK